MFLVLIVIKILLYGIKLLTKRFNKLFNLISKIDQIVFSDSGMYDIIDMSYN